MSNPDDVAYWRVQATFWRESALRFHDGEQAALACVQELESRVEELQESHPSGPPLQTRIEELEFSWSGCATELETVCEELTQARKRIEELEAANRNLTDAMNAHADGEANWVAKAKRYEAALREIAGDRPCGWWTAIAIIALKDKP